MCWASWIPAVCFQTFSWSTAHLLVVVSHFLMWINQWRELVTARRVASYQVLLDLDDQSLKTLVFNSVFLCFNFFFFQREWDYPWSNKWAMSSLSSSTLWQKVSNQGYELKFEQFVQMLCLPLFTQSGAFVTCMKEPSGWDSYGPDWMRSICWKYLGWR